jgi:hypothetical protein
MEHSGPCLVQRLSLRRPVPARGQRHDHLRNVLAEMRLCFDISGVGLQASSPWNQLFDPWSHLGFFFTGLVNPPPGTTSESGYPSFVSDADLDQLVPAPPPAMAAEERPIMRFHLVWHTPCSLPDTAPLASHLQGSLSYKHDVYITCYALLC